MNREEALDLLQEEALKRIEKLTGESNESEKNVENINKKVGLESLNNK